MSHPEMHLRTRRGGGRLRPIHFKEESISLCHPERELWISRRTEILRCAQDDTPESASFDSQNVFFEMDCPVRRLRSLPYGFDDAIPILPRTTGLRRVPS